MIICQILNKRQKNIMEGVVLNLPESVGAGGVGEVSTVGAVLLQERGG